MLTIEQVIDGFQQSVKEAVQPFYDKYKRKDLLRAWHDGMFSQRGKVGHNMERYFFHGIGLEVHLKGKSIDFDFGNGNRIDGFNAYRLLSYLDSQADHKGKWTLREIENELKRLTQEGKIYQLEGDYNYYKHEARHLDPSAGTAFVFTKFYTVSAHSIAHKYRTGNRKLAIGILLVNLSVIGLGFNLVGSHGHLMFRPWMLEDWLIWGVILLPLGLGVWQTVRGIKDLALAHRMKEAKKKYELDTQKEQQV